MLRRLAKRTLPAPVRGPVSRAVDAWLGRKYTRVEPLVREITGGVVGGGPFTGLRYPPRSSWAVSSPNLIGSYEAELHGDLERLIADKPSRVVDVGSADGYYAVGLAMRLPHAEVFAFDIAEDAQRVTAQMARLNGVSDRVHVAGEASHATLQELCGPGALLVVDIEGAEADLLDSAAAPALAETTVLVEFHDFVDPSISSSVLTRFAATHDATLRQAQRRDPDDWPLAAGLGRRDAAVAVDERRRFDPPQEWAVLRPRN